MRVSSIAHAGISWKNQWPIEVSLCFSLDLLSIPEYVIKKGRPHGHRYGKLSENKEYHQAHNLKKRCIKKQFKGIHHRILRAHVFFELMIENKRDEDACRAWDVLAEQDHSYHMSESECFHYRQNWWISLNKSGNNTQPVRKRSDSNQALSTLNRLHQEAGGQQLGADALLEIQRMEPASSSPPPGGNGGNLGGLPKNSKKVNKRGCKQRFAIERGQPVVYRTLAKTSDE